MESGFSFIKYTIAMHEGIRISITPYEHSTRNNVEITYSHISTNTELSKIIPLEILENEAIYIWFLENIMDELHELIAQKSLNEFE